MVAVSGNTGSAPDGVKKHLKEALNAKSKASYTNLSIGRKS